MIDLEEVKGYLRLEPDDDDDDYWIAKTLIPAVESYLHKAGIKSEEAKEDALYKLAVQMLACHWNENRMIIGNVTQTLEFSLTSIITQLQYSYD